MNCEHTGKSYRQHHDKARQRARQSDIEEARREGTGDFMMNASPRPKHRWLRNEKGVASTSQQ